MELNPEERKECFELMAQVEKAQASLTNAESLLGDGFIDMAKMSIQQSICDLTPAPKRMSMGQLMDEEDNKRKLKRMEDKLKGEE